MTSSRGPHIHHAKLGGLHHKLILESPKRVHYGNDFPVSGNVLLKHLPLLRGLNSPLNAELFGPLHVSIVLKGVARIHHEDESRAEIFPLCKEVVTIYDGSFRAPADAEEVLHFNIKLPPHASPVTNTAVAAVQDDGGNWSFRERVSSVEVEELPPTLEVLPNSLTRGSFVYANLHTTMKPAIKVHYTVEAQVRMPGIDVEIVNADADSGGAPIFYDQPRIPIATAQRDQTLTTDVSQRFTVQDESLLPEHEQPHGFRNKTKAFLKPIDLPKFVFDVICIGIPQHAYVGQNLSFAITIQPDGSSTTKTDPEIFLDKCTISLIAQTTGIQPAPLEILKTKAADFSSARPFSREDGMTKGIDVGVLSWVPATFTFRKITRTYKLRIVGRFTVGTQQISTSRDVPITIHPPLEIETSRAADDTNDPDALPSYQEANRHEAEDFAHAPSYEQAISGSDSASGHAIGHASRHGSGHASGYTGFTN
ncbi:hypothetical protein CERZMDRAFT_88829 [Cercospora zeae-maydis SCOH1-5]|uniref:Arrestin-like N-terminal domain-containing protein n=1 Tax=Cercospora zeae-maydis SCOH1-5 TaxID=717836 RepID=A0A6A6F3Z9_9PEZI|nr:hypothetical protein CERZMDRAFT_88829 [Cercospora zeae-maydis SCOH1-5]